MPYRSEMVERRRRRNAKRFLWVIVIVAFLVIGLVLYTSLTASDEAPRMSERSHAQSWPIVQSAPGR